MGKRIRITLLNWRWWVALPVILVIGSVALIGGICGVVSAIFGAAAQAIEEINIRPLIDWTRRSHP